MEFLLGVFLLMHGAVHLLYVGQALRLFELKPGLQWPDAALLFSRRLGARSTRLLAVTCLLLATAGFFLGAAGLMFMQLWWPALTAGAAAFSIILYLLFWDGKFEILDAQGGIGILIDLLILLSLWIQL